MRRIYRICAMLTIVAVIFNVLFLVMVYGSSVNNRLGDISTWNWEFITPAIIVSGLIMLIGASGVVTIGLTEDSWKTISELYKEMNSYKLAKQKYEIATNKLAEKLSDETLNQLIDEKD